MNKLLSFFVPPDKWKLPVIILLGILTGMGANILKMSKAHSYLSDNPATCTNCHIMAPQYATWYHSRHRTITNCNDCHVPHNNAINKYYFKAKDGMRHSAMFTFRLEPQVIKIKDEGKGVVHNNCVRCHEHLLTDNKMNQRSMDFRHNRNGRVCWECHRETPHGRVNSLSSVPFARVPLPESPVPMWLKKWMNETNINR